MTVLRLHRAHVLDLSGPAPPLTIPPEKPHRRAMSKPVPPMNATELRDCLIVIGWSQLAFAKVLEVDEKSVRRWSMNLAPVPDRVADWLRNLRKLIEPARKRLEVSIAAAHQKYPAPTGRPAAGPEHGAGSSGALPTPGDD